MNDSQLDKLLKAAPVPERAPDYWDQFPRRVTARIHWQTRRAETSDAAEVRRPAPAAWRWGLGLATACVIVGFAIGHWRGRVAEANSGPLQNRKFIGEMLAMFPNRLRAIVQDERGLNLVLSDKDDVPVSPPLWVRICDGKRCSVLVTFSGQDVQVAGVKVTVLSDAHGGVLLVGDRFVWSSGEHKRAADQPRIETRELAPISAG